MDGSKYIEQSLHSYKEVYSGFRGIYRHRLPENTGKNMDGGINTVDVPINYNIGIPPYKEGYMRHKWTIS